MLIICFPICCPKQNKKTCGIANSRLNNNQSKKKHTLNPNWVTGFCDAESSFSVSIIKTKTTIIGWSVSPCFIITLHVKDLELLKTIKKFFNEAGSINISENFAHYKVRSRKDLSIIITLPFGP